MKYYVILRNIGPPTNRPYKGQCKKMNGQKSKAKGSGREKWKKNSRKVLLSTAGKNPLKGFALEKCFMLNFKEAFLSAFFENLSKADHHDLYYLKKPQSGVFY